MLLASLCVAEKRCRTRLGLLTRTLTLISQVEWWPTLWPIILTSKVEWWPKLWPIILTSKVEWWPKLWPIILTSEVELLPELWPITLSSKVEWWPHSKLHWWAWNGMKPVCNGLLKSLMRLLLTRLIKSRLCGRMFPLYYNISLALSVGHGQTRSDRSSFLH